MQRLSASRYSKLQSTDKEMCTALNVITSILGGLNGRKVELAEYMGRIRKPEGLKKTLAWVFDGLKGEKINTKLLELTESSSYNTLLDYVNAKSVDKLSSEATASYQQLEVT